MVTCSCGRKVKRTAQCTLCDSTVCQHCFAGHGLPEKGLTWDNFSAVQWRVLDFVNGLDVEERLRGPIQNLGKLLSVTIANSLSDLADYHDIKSTEDMDTVVLYGIKACYVLHSSTEFHA